MAMSCLFKEASGLSLLTFSELLAPRLVILPLDFIAPALDGGANPKESNFELTVSKRCPLIEASTFLIRTHQ